MHSRERERERGGEGKSTSLRTLSLSDDLSLRAIRIIALIFTRILNSAGIINFCPKTSLKVLKELLNIFLINDVPN